MIDHKELNALGLPNNKKIMTLALQLINTALADGADVQELKANISAMCNNPARKAEHPLFGDLAALLADEALSQNLFEGKATVAPWQKWGNINAGDPAAIQMQNACSLPIAVRGALMPDAHTGYGLPIGGVLAVKDAVIPYAVGVDIACRMRLSVLDIPLKNLKKRRESFIAALEKETRFGVGAGFETSERREHAVMDKDWGLSKISAASKDKAWKQLGSSGSGNHFVEFGELHIDEATEIGNIPLQKGSYLALLSHSGSRGAGESVAEYYSKLAMSLHSDLAQEVKHLAWLDLNSEAGIEYWAAMQLMGEYAAANHELIHKHVLQNIGAEAICHVENHHNFAWLEEHDGKQLVVHRKGATPAGQGVQGIVPGSMGAPGFVVRGKANSASLHSCSHGAGRLMSRSAALKKFNKDDVQTYLKKRGVELISGGLDEAPMAYKNIHTVMAAQQDLVDILARFEPRLVKMAPDKNRRPRWQKKKR